jgi:hypothetical protein
MMLVLAHVKETNSNICFPYQNFASLQQRQANDMLEMDRGWTHLDLRGGFCLSSTTPFIFTDVSNGVVGTMVPTG